MPYITLIEMGISFLTPFISGMKGAKVPTEIIASAEKVLEALILHKQDVINKQNLDALRG